MDDRALDLKLDALAANVPRAPEDPPWREMLIDAVPFEWTAQAFLDSDNAAVRFPFDGTAFLPSDLIEPRQFWIYPPSDRSWAEADAPLITDTACLAADWGDSLLVVRFARVASVTYRSPLFPWGAVAWPYGPRDEHTTTRFYPLTPPTSPRADSAQLDEFIEEVRSFACHIVASQFWLRSKVAVATPQLLSRGARRRAMRAQLPAHDVRVVTLRDAEPSGSAADRAAHEFSCRWLRGPFWRQQYLPSTGEHRPTLVSQHVVGPEDKPLLVHTEKRYRVTR